MSSDDSDVQEGRAVYYVRKRIWRSKRVTERLIAIDAERNTTNAFNKPRPGNPFRHRTRSANNKTSSRDPTIGLPSNFYSKGYLRNLNNLHHRALQMARAYDFGTIVDA